MTGSSTRHKGIEAIAKGLRDVAYSCGRVWEAWQYGTMSQNDFSPAWEDDELLDSLVAELVAAGFISEPQNETTDELLRMMRTTIPWSRELCVAIEAKVRDLVRPSWSVPVGAPENTEATDDELFDLAACVEDAPYMILTTNEGLRAVYNAGRSGVSS